MLMYMIQPPPVYNLVTSQFILRNKNETEKADKEEVQEINKIISPAFLVIDLQFFRELMEQMNMRHKESMNQLIDRIQTLIIVVKTDTLKPSKVYLFRFISRQNKKLVRIFIK